MNAALTGSPPRVTTQQGELEGFVEEGVAKFFGIPFAQPPVDERRWRAPEPPVAWEGVREAKAFSAAPYQTIAIPASLRADGISEDCLYLNVWTGTTDPAARQPVLVWFFGGGNLRGAASVDLYDGSELAKLGVTVVTPNYRVGCFGFLNDATMGANFAIQDDVAALRWVRDNIAAFGGDPDCVTVFGNSAGAVAVRSLIECPEARGLYHRAYMQSAGFDDPASGKGWSHDRSRAATEQLWDALGTRDPAELRALPVETIGAASHPLSGIFADKDQVHTPLNLVWMPVIDGTVLCDDEPGWPDDVPLLVSCTENEGRWTLSPTENYTPELLANMCRHLAGERADEVLAILDKGGGSVFEKLDRLYTMAVWTEPAYTMLKRFAANGRNALYYAHFKRSGPEAVVSERLAQHGSPVAYLFGTLTDDGSYDDVDARISREMMAALVEFARTGVPRSSGGQEWPRFDPAQPRQTTIGDSIAAGIYRVTPLLRAINGLRDDRAGDAHWDAGAALAGAD